MKLSECIKKLEDIKGREFYPFFVPHKVIQQIKMMYFPQSNFPMSEWSMDEIAGEVIFNYANKIAIKIDRFGLVHPLASDFTAAPSFPNTEVPVGN